MLSPFILRGRRGGGGEGGRGRQIGDANYMKKAQNSLCNTVWPTTKLSLSLSLSPKSDDVVDISYAHKTTLSPSLSLSLSLSLSSLTQNLWCKKASEQKIWLLFTIESHTKNEISSVQSPGHCSRSSPHRSHKRKRKKARKKTQPKLSKVKKKVKERESKKIREEWR